MSARLERITDPESIRLATQTLDHLFVDVLVNEQSFPAQADLSLIGEGGRGRHRDGWLQIGVLEDDRRVLPAHLEGDLAETRCHRLGDVTSRRGPAGEGDGADTGVVDDRLANLGPETMDDVEYAGGEADFLSQFPKHPGGDRSQLRGLGDHGVAGGQGRCNLPGEEIQREIPG